jgi:hypothetical protein
VTESASVQRSLPTWDQVDALWIFIHGRTYAAAVPTIRLDGEPPHAPGSGLARGTEVNSALYDVTSHLCRRLYDELESGHPVPIAHASWDALLMITAAWREDPELPGWVNGLLPVKPR